MCGIAGKIIVGNKSVNHKDLENMSRAIAHRGPDDAGIYISPDKKVGFVNRRLAIIDLSDKGHMPMHYLNKYTITYNGEIYNFPTIKNRLKLKGYKFRTGTDTEVILALYDCYGFECLNYLRGMFAFALFDKEKNIIFLARDRIGKKPLKYYWKDGVFIFASEFKAILTDPLVKRIPDWKAIYDYLTFGYVLPPQTGFIDIQKLLPAHYLVLDIQKGILIKNRYWKPNFSHKLELSENEWEERILSTLRESTKLRMISDVPIGAFLSGGVDSSAVVALMSEVSNKPINTFTIGFTDKRFNEIDHAKRIADKFHTNHTELIVKPESVEILPDLVKQYEEPYADASATVTSLVSKLARKKVTVILNGDGGDENFAGYDRYARIRRDVFLDTIQPLIRPLALPLLKSGSHKLHFLQKALNFFEKSKTPLSNRLESYIHFFSENEKTIFFNRTGFSPSFYAIQKAFQESETSDPRDQVLFWDLTRYLPEDLLVKVDIASMSVGLEARSPMLDQQFVELACQIPFDLKLKGKEHKYILKKALEGIVPTENLYRKKVGFSVPLSEWFTGKLNDYTKSVLLNKNAYLKEILDQKLIKKMLQNHTTENDYGPRLWSLLTLELWFNAYFP